MALKILHDDEKHGVFYHKRLYLTGINIIAEADYTITGGDYIIADGDYTIGIAVYSIPYEQYLLSSFLVSLFAMNKEQS